MQEQTNNQLEDNQNSIQIQGNDEVILENNQEQEQQENTDQNCQEVSHSNLQGQQMDLEVKQNDHVEDQQNQHIVNAQNMKDVIQMESSDDETEQKHQRDHYKQTKNQAQSRQPAQRTFTKLQQTSRMHIQMQEKMHQSQIQEAESYFQDQEIYAGQQKVKYDLNSVTKFRVAMIVSTFGEAEALTQYINGYLCDRRLYIRDWPTHFRISAFIVQWLHLTVPKQLKKFQAFQIDSMNSTQTNHPIPCGSYSRFFSCIFTLLNQQQEIYNCRYSNNSVELLQKLVNYNQENFKDKKDITVVRQEFLLRPIFNVSIFFINTLENFGKCGGFELLILAISSNQNSQNSKAQEVQADTHQKNFIPSFYFLSQVVDLIFSVKEYIIQDIYIDLVRNVLKACLSFSRNKQDQESLRHVSKRDLLTFISRIERLSNGLNQSQNNQDLNDLQKDSNAYQITELIELELALTCLKMPILEKKFIGHSILTQKINQVLSRNVLQDQKQKLINEPNQINSSSQFKQNNFQQKNQSHEKSIDKEYLIDWMCSNNIFNAIFGESLHPEVIKKSYFLIEFLYKNGKIQEAQIDLMWKCAMQKHEVYRNEILKALISLSSKAEYNELNVILKLIQTVPLNHTDKFIMLLLKTIAQNISSKITGVFHETNKKSSLEFGSSRRMRILMDPTRLQKIQTGDLKGGIGQRRMSDVGIQKSKMLENSQQEKQSLIYKPHQDGLFKVSPWDDHDISNNIKKNDAETFLRFQPGYQKNRSSSFTKKNNEFKITPIENNYMSKQQINDGPQNQTNEIKKQENEIDNEEISNFNITDVPAEKEDKNTTDEDYSPKQNTLYNVDNNQCFENDSQNHFQDSKSQNQNNCNLDSDLIKQSKENIKVKLNVHHQEEEKKQESRQQNIQRNNFSNKISVKQFLFDLHIDSTQNKTEDQIDQQKKNQYKKLGINVLKLMWTYCMEEIVNPHQINQGLQQNNNNEINRIQNHEFDQNMEIKVGQLSQQVYQTTIDSFCQVINRDFPLASFFFINLCVQNLKRSYSVISSQKILQKLIQETQFPILNFESNQIQIKDKCKLPKNQEELILALDNDLKITNECLSSYVEFKRNSVQLIFEQFGDLDNELIGVIGEQVENLETQSSLDNNTNQTGEERSRFSQSIVSSTQKSDTADYFTNISRSQQKSNQQRRVKQPHSNQITKVGERGQSFPKIQPQQTSKQESQQESSFSMNILEGEPNSSSFNTSSKIVQEDINQLQNLEQPNLDQIFAFQKTNSLQINENKDLIKQSSLIPNSKKDKQDEKKSLNQKFDLNTQIQKITKTNENQNQSESNIQKQDDKQQKQEQVQQQKQKETKKQQSQGESSDYQSGISESQASQDQSQTSQNSQVTANNPQNQNRQFLNSLITNRAFQLNFIQEMNQRIDFFKFLTKNSQCKTLKAPQINILWECLVVNAFNEEERDLFFVLCSDLLSTVQQNELKKLQKLSMEQDFDQQLDQNIADALLFEEDVFELIFYEILLRLDYKNSDNSGGLTLSMYSCFERFFMYVNERYGQIETKQRSRSILNDIYSPQIQIVVYDHQLIGIEALWEIILGAQDERIYKKASLLLMKLFKNLASDNENEAAPNIKELFYQNCLNQIRAGLKDIDEKNTQLLKASQFNRNEIQQIQSDRNALSNMENFRNELNSQQHDLNIGQLQNQLHPDLANSVSIDESRNRISRSIHLLSQFIIDFEQIKGKRNDQDGRNKQQNNQVAIAVSNQISNTSGPFKINLNLPSHTSVFDLKNQIGKSLIKQQNGRELCLIYRGKELNEDLKTLKELGMNSHQPNGLVEPVKILLTLKSSLDLQADNIQDTENETQYQEAQLNENVETLKMFLEDLKASNDVIKLALKKCKLNLEEAILMLTNPEQVEDLEDEIKCYQEANEQAQIMSNINSKAVNVNQEEAIIIDEIKLSEMVSNREESFDLLINLLNLGIPEITQASWSLLSQVPINQKLLNQIRLLEYVSSSNQEGVQNKFTSSNERDQKCIQQMSEAQWNRIIDPESTHKMLYSLQLVNQLITINNEKLTDHEIHERFNWRQRFLELGGFNHLYKILLSYNLDQLEEQLQLESKNQKQILLRSKSKNQFNENNQDQLNGKKNNISVFKITQAQCLAHLVSIIKIFLQAAILSDDEKNLLNLIASSSTSPFKRQRIQQNPQNINQTVTSNEVMSSNNSVGESHSDKDASSVATAKFANSFTQNAPFETTRSANDDHFSDQNMSAKKEPDNNSQSSVPSKKQTGLGQKSISHNFENSQQNNNLAIGTQVDDFPKLIEQISQGGLAKKIIQNIDFATFITKLLKILQISTSYFNEINDLQNCYQDGYTQNKQQKSFQVIQSIILDDPNPILIQNCLDILLPCLLWDPSQLIQQLYEFQHFQKFIVQGLLKSQSERIRKCIEQNFKTLCYYIDDLENKKLKQNKPYTSENTNQIKQDGTYDQLRLNPKQFLLKILFENLPQSMINGRFKNQEGEFYEEFFNLLSSLIKICKDEFYQNYEENANQIESSIDEFYSQEKQKFLAKNILNFCIDQIKLNQLIFQGQMISIDNKKPNSPKISGAERQLCGYLQLCQSLLEVLPELKEKAANQCNLINIITDFILNINIESDLNSKQIVKSSSNLKKQVKNYDSKQLGRLTKKKAFGLLLTLCEKTEVNFSLTLKILYKFYEKVSQSWQYLDLKELDSEVGIKQQSGYVGLKNFGCTCYMNSLLQQLFMIPSLRAEVLEIDTQSLDSKQNIPKDENLLYQLQSVFANLQETEKSYFAPKGFVSAFKFYGEPVNVRVQQDTHEFYNVLCDQIEQLLPNSNSSKEEDKEKQHNNNFLKRTIGGTLCNQTKSLESNYPYVGEREEDFYAITLDIKNKKSIQEALDLYIKPDILEGENKYLCEQYDKKISAQRRSYLKDLSNTVAINLKRFEFDYNTMQRLKVNDYCEFPERINFKKWTKEGILEAEKQVAGEEKENNPINQDQESFEFNSEIDGEENIIDEEEAKNNQNYIDQEAVGGEQMDKGIDFNDDEIHSERFKKNQNKFEISQTVIAASGGSRNYKQRRVRSSNKKRSQDKERLLEKQQNSVNQITNKKRTDESINLSRQLSEKDSSPLRNRQVKSIGIREFKAEKDQAIIDEDAFSEDARSVNRIDKAVKIKQEIDISRNQQKKQKQNKQNRSGYQDNALTKRDDFENKKKQNEKYVIDQYEYQLVGVLVHSGSADAGHYYSYIKERNKNSQNYGKWFEFNDTTVKQFNIQNLKKECFGGQGNSNRATDENHDQFENQNQNKQYRFNERCCNAYLIFYERVNCIPDLQNINNSVLEAQKKQMHLQNIFNKIHQQNQAFKHLKMFSDNDFVKFIKDYINLCIFSDVLYFTEKFSESEKMASYRELTEHYAKDWNSQMRKALRLQETQELKGEIISPLQIQLKKNYFQEQILIKQNSSESNIFLINEDEKDIDIGLKTIQMATILAQDLLLKLKDTQSFVQLLQKLNQMYQSHAVACVWFIKWITEEDSILQEILLASNYPEVRESFAILISTTFGITIMNEEKYLNVVEQFCDFECDQKTIERGDVNKRRINKSAAFRLVKLFIHRIINQAKVYWRNFDDFFNLLKDFAQSHFQVAAYLIERGLIGILLEFIMNNKVPFYNSQGGQMYKMGDSVSQPNFQHVYSLFSYLIKCCLTKGITAVKHYSPYSVFQEENKSIMLPEDNIAGFLTPECIEEIIDVSLTCSEIQNQSVEEIIGHLSWGDIKVSQFFLKEFIKHIRIKKGQINILQALMNPIQVILKLDDNKALKKQRMDFILNFGENIMSQQYISENQFGNSSNSLGLVNFLYRIKDSYPIYLLIILNFIGKLATSDNKDSIIKEKLQEIKNYLQEWVLIFISRVLNDSLLVNRAKQKFNIQLDVIAKETALRFADIYYIKDQNFKLNLESNNSVDMQQAFDTLKIQFQKQKEQQDEILNVQREQTKNVNDDQRKNESQGQNIEYYQSDGEEESIFKLIPDDKGNQQSFASLNNHFNENPIVATHQENLFQGPSDNEEEKNDYLDLDHVL